MPAAAGGRRTHFRARQPTARCTFSGQLDRTAVLPRQRWPGAHRARRSPPRAGEAGAPARRPTDLARHPRPLRLDGRRRRSSTRAPPCASWSRSSARTIASRWSRTRRARRCAIPLTARRRPGRAALARRPLPAITPDGGTNMSSGLDLGLDADRERCGAGRVPRVDPDLRRARQPGRRQRRRARLAARQRAARGEYMLSTVGVGADFNEYLMTALADAGTGNYYFLQRADGLARRLRARVRCGAHARVATGLAVQIAPARGVRVRRCRRLSARAGRRRRRVFRPGSLFAGQERRIWVTLAVPQQTLGDVRARPLLALLRGRRPSARRCASPRLPRVACVAERGATSTPASTRGVDALGRRRRATTRCSRTVAREVKAGRRDEAARGLQEFRTKTATMNDRLQSAPVAAQLESPTCSTQRSTTPSTGADQRGGRTSSARRASAAAFDARRPGSKK